MKAHLLYRDRDLDWDRALPAHEPALTQDLELDAWFKGMADGDELILKVVKQVVFSGLQDELDTVLYRQAVLQDCLRNHAVVKGIYDLAVDAIEGKRKQWLGIFGNYPSGILHGAVELMQMFSGFLAKLKQIADEHSGEFKSEGITAFFALVKAELADDYLADIQGHLKELRFSEGVWVSAQLGKGNEGAGYVLRRSPARNRGWLQRAFARRPRGFTFYISDRDEAGARALGELNDRGINLVANALAQSADHILSFFVMLRRELAFYIGGVNLHRLLAAHGAPICFPIPALAGARRHTFVGLCDVPLVLGLGHRAVGNDMEGDGKGLVIITGANQGGKSTFLRSIGVAQVMMQCGLFVAAESFAAEICHGLVTHYKREEDAAMESGKFDEELGRMSTVADLLVPDSLMLFNESFAATNEREGSEIARQIVRALLEARVKVFFVSHQYDFAHSFWDTEKTTALFLRAERQEGGQRTFKLRPGEPLQTSYGADLYREIFGGEAGEVGQ